MGGKPRLRRDHHRWALRAVATLAIATATCSCGVCAGQAAFAAFRGRSSARGGRSTLPQAERRRVEAAAWRHKGGGLGLVGGGGLAAAAVAASTRWRSAFAPRSRPSLSGSWRAPRTPAWSQTKSIVVQEADEDLPADPDDDDPEQGDRIAWGQLLVLPIVIALCVFLLKETDILEEMPVTGRFEDVLRIALEAGDLLISVVVLGAVKGHVFGDSVLTAFALIRNIMKRLKIAEWRQEIVMKASYPAARVVQGMMVFLALNLLMHSMPVSWHWKLPPFLSFLDIVGDGKISPLAIAKAFYAFSSRVMGGYFVVQLGSYMLNAKRPPHSEVPAGGHRLRNYLHLLQQSERARKKGIINSDKYMKPKLVDKVLTVVIWVMVALCLRALSGVKLQTILALGGVGGLAVSLAAKNIAQNFISGVLIFLNRSLVEGEEIISTDGKIDGIVEKVGPTVTTVRRIQGEQLLVPNAKLVDDAIINRERRDFWRVEHSFQLIIPDFLLLPEVVKAMQDKLLELTKDVEPHQERMNLTVFEPPVVAFEGYGHQGANIAIRAYLDGTLSRHGFFQKRSEILLALSDVALNFDGAQVGLEVHWVGGGKGGTGGGGGHH